jgi:hypothetical protein
MGLSWSGFPQDSRESLAEAAKRYHNLGKRRIQDYRFVRVEFSLLTSDLFCAILSAPGGGKQITPQSYRKEEVMSKMDSSNKPSAAASLLK